MSLILVTTPIGNNDDITLRGKAELIDSSIIYCEDTRKTKDLLKRLGIDYSSKDVFSFHDHSGEAQINAIIERASRVKVCYVSDAGSPMISDPALPLVRAAIANKIPIESASGISSIIYALEVSGLPSIPFTFHGFLGRQNKDLDDFASQVKSNLGTHIFFEGVSRVEKTLSYLIEKLSDFEFVIARELTKTHEQVVRFKASDFESVNSEITYKGEFVILVHNSSSQTISNDKLISLAQDVIAQKGKAKTLAKLLSEITGEKTKDIYSQLN